MHSLMFPTTVVDNFLDEPQQYVSFANSLEFYFDPTGRVPGSRTNNLVITHPNVVNRIVCKILSLFYNFDKDSVGWDVAASFQKIDSRFVEGWIHADNDAQLTSIIYLCESGFGTSIYKPKDIKNLKGFIHTEKKHESYKNPDDLYSFVSFRRENNVQFSKSITVDSQFNRLLCFEGGCPHGADNFISSENNLERLTMVLFISNIRSKTNFPIQRLKFFI